MITKTHKRTRQEPPDLLALADAATHGEYVLFRGLLSNEREMMHEHAAEQIPEWQVDECVETATMLAYRRFLSRPHNMSLKRWLMSLLHEAIQTRDDRADMLNESAHA